jgi:hypothetical protein
VKASKVLIKMILISPGDAANRLKETRKKRDKQRERERERDVTSGTNGL